MFSPSFLDLSLPLLSRIVIGGIIIFSPLLEGGTTHFSVMVIRLLLLVLCAFYLWQGARERQLICPSIPIGWPAVVFLGLAAFSTVRSPYAAQSVQWLLVIGGYSLWLYLLVCFIRSWKNVSTVVMVVVCMGLFEAGLALLQGVRMGQVRPAGTFFNPNFLAGYVAAAGLMALGYASYLRIGHQSRSILARSESYRVVLALLILGLFFYAAILAGSRGATLAFFVGSAFVVGMRFGKKGLICIAALLVAVVLLPTPLRERVLSEHFQNPVGYARWQIWASALAGMLDYPLGVGLGLFQYVYPQYAFPVEDQIVRYGQVATTAHNEYLQMGVEMGFAGILVIIWGVVALIREAKWVLSQRLKRWQRGLIVGVIGAAISLLVHASVDSSLHEPALAIVLVLCAALVMSVRTLLHQAPAGTQLTIGGSRFAFNILAVALICSVALYAVTLGMAWSWFEVGEEHLSRQEYQQAQAAYEAAVGYDPGKSTYHSALALAYFRRFERTRDLAVGNMAISELAIASKLNPLDGRLQGLLGRVYLALASSLESAEASTSEQRDNKKRWLLEAESHYRHALKLEPYGAPYYFQLAILSKALGNEPGAIDLANQAVALEPNYLTARAWLLRRYLERAEHDRARQEFAEITERHQRFTARTKSLLEKEFLAVDLQELERIYAQRLKT